MKRFAMFLVVCLITGRTAIGQVAISTDNSDPDPSAMLDVKSTSKGILVPRMTIAERNAISSPASGLLVFCTDNSQYFSNKGTPTVPNWIMVSSQWLNNGNNIYFNSGNVGIGVASPTALSLQVNGKIGASYGSVTSPGFTFDNGIENTGFSSPAAFSISFITQATEKMRLNQAGALGIGTSSPNVAAIVEISSTNKGFLPPRMTMAQRNAIVNPADGLIVFCSNCDNDGSAVLSVYENGFWQSISLACVTPVPPTEGAHVQANTQIVWNWSAVPIAQGYKWHTTNNFAAATDLGTLTTKTETGLFTGSSYTRYVWSYNNCGVSEPTILTGQALSCGSSFSKTHFAGLIAPVDKTITYGTVTNIAGEPTKCWITRNLGAKFQAVQVNDGSEESTGWFWQFNRKQGYKHDGVTRTPNTSWIIGVIENSNWESINDPCFHLLGSAWRIPTFTEWNNLDNSGGWTDRLGPWNSGLKLHAAGYLHHADAFLTYNGIKGFYWSTAQDITEWGNFLNFDIDVSAMSRGDKAYAFPLRCLRD